MKRIGVLTSGGDAPGMNQAVAAVARLAAHKQMELIGIQGGYRGLLFAQDGKPGMETETLSLQTVLSISGLSGTYLGTARCDAFREPAYQRKAAGHIRDAGIEGMVIIGGDGSYQGAMRLCELGIPCIGIPGTIDNDLAYTDSTLGFDTAINTCVTAIRAIQSTARSHERPSVVEVMGRHCGDIALHAAIATGAEVLIVPEVPWSIEEKAARLQQVILSGNPGATVVVAEGAYDAMAPFDVCEYLTPRGKQCFPGEPVTAVRLASIFKRMCGGAEVRATVLGYPQRGGVPSGFDSTFAFEAAELAVDLLHGGESNRVIGYKEGKVFSQPIAEALAVERKFDQQRYALINSL